MTELSEELPSLAQMNDPTVMKTLVWIEQYRIESRLVEQEPQHHGPLEPAVPTCARVMGTKRE